jgi:hypothetical protein
MLTRDVRRMLQPLAVSFGFCLAAEGLIAQDFAVGDYQVVNSTRVGRTEFVYELKVVVTNRSAVSHQLAARVTSNSTNTTVLQGSVFFPEVAASSYQRCTNTFFIRQNRINKFDPSSLHWAVVVQPLSLSITEPPDGFITSSPVVAVQGVVNDPGANVTIQGVDATLAGTNFTLNALSLTEGTNRLVAQSRSDLGGQAAAASTVFLDTSAPQLTVLSPSDRSILSTSQVEVRGMVQDLTDVSCSVNGTGLAVTKGSFSGYITLASGSNSVLVTAQDAAGNRSSKSLSLFFDPQPLSITGMVPTNGAEHVDLTSAVQVFFSKQVAPASLDASSFFLRDANLLLPAEVRLSPDGLSATLTPRRSLRPATRLDVAVTTGLSDEMGIPLRFPFAGSFTTTGTQSWAGVVVGEVYNDARSLPMQGASVQVLTIDRQQVLGQGATDESGRYLINLSTVPALVSITQAGFTSVERLLANPSSQLADMLDARLTPHGPSQTIPAVSGGQLQTSAGDLLSIPPEAFTTDAHVVLTSISSQGPRNAFPLGWTPLDIIDIGMSESLSVAGSLTMAISSNGVGRAAVLAKYDEASACWMAMTNLSIPPNGLVQFNGVTSSGQFALLLPDLGADTPPEAVPGALLLGATEVAIPAAATAVGQVIPASRRADDPTPAAAKVTVSASTALRSGTLLRGDFTEMYLLRNGEKLSPLNASQDFWAYRSPADTAGTNLLASFAIAASRTFKLTELTEGTVSVSLFRGTLAERNVTGPDGGGIQTSDGSRVIIPPGALDSLIPVDLKILEAAAFSGLIPSGVTFVGGLELDLSGKVSNRSLGLSIGNAASLVPQAAQVVVAQLRQVQNSDRLVFVALARIDGTALTVINSLDGVALPGVRAGGRYCFLCVNGTLAGVTGTARDQSGRRDGHLIAVDYSPFVSVTDADGFFAVVSSPGSFRLVATGAVIHDQAIVTGSAPAQLGEIVILPTPPQVSQIFVRPARVEGDFAGPVVLLGQPKPVIDDGSSPLSRGNANGIIEPGERVELRVSARNNGNLAMPKGSFALRVRNNGVSLPVEPATISVDGLAPDLAVTAGPFRFDVPTDANPAQLSYTLVWLTEAGGVTEIPFRLPLGVDHPNVSVSSEVTVRFTEPVIEAGLKAGLFLQQQSPTGAVLTASKVLLSQDGTIATLRPLAALLSDTVYRVVLASSVVDFDGRSLAGAPITNSLQTEDLTPPMPINPGQIEALVPDADGFVTITGTLGTVNPDDIVIVLNQNSGFTVLATVRTDGSFTARVRAEVTDLITILVRDRNNNETTLNIDSFIRRDAASGNLLGVTIGKLGGKVTSPDGVELTVPAGAVKSATEFSVSRASTPFTLPPDIAADPSLSLAFSNQFSVVGRVQISANVSSFGSPLHLSLPPPPGAGANDLFLVVRPRTATVGGPLADLDLLTGLATTNNPVTNVTRFVPADSATVKVEKGNLVLSTDSPPFPGITAPGEYTILQIRSPLTFLSGEVRRDSTNGLPVAGAIVRSMAASNGTASFAAETDSQGRFVVADSGAGGPYMAGSTVASRLDINDPKFKRVIRCDVRGVVTSSGPPNAVIAALESPVVLPSALPAVFVGILGDTEPPTVRIGVSGVLFNNGLARAGDTLRITVTAGDNDAVDVVSLLVNGGDGYVVVPRSPDGTYSFTPTRDGLVMFAAEARDRSGNAGASVSTIRSALSAQGVAPTYTVLNGSPPVIIETEAEVAFDADFAIQFSEPLDSGTVTGDSVRLQDPQGNLVAIGLKLEAQNSRIRVKPRRNLRLGASYTVILSREVTDSEGQAFSGSVFTFVTPPPVQVARILLQNAEDVATLRDHIVVVTHPDGVSPSDKGALHTYQVVDASDPSQPLSEPIRLASKTVTGRPQSIAIDGSTAYVANRFLGSIHTMDPVVMPYVPWGEASPDIPLGFLVDPLSPLFPTWWGIFYVDRDMPSPASNLEVFDLSDPSQPVRQGGSILDSVGPPFTIYNYKYYNPNSFPTRIEICSQGVGVLNFLENLQFFNPSASPTSLGFFGRVLKYGEAQTETEYTDVAYFNGFAVVLEREGIRTISTSELWHGVGQGVPAGAKFRQLSGASTGRIGGVSGFQWTDETGTLHNSDLAFVAIRPNWLWIFEVTGGSSPQFKGLLSDAFGNMSFDSEKGLAFVGGANGSFNVVDFNDPTHPVELNNPDVVKNPFRLEGVGNRVSMNGNANHNGLVFLTSESGVEVVHLGTPAIFKVPLGGRLAKNMPARFKVYVPDRWGGCLTIGVTASGRISELRFPDGSLVPDGEGLAPLTVDVGEGRHGWYTFRVEASGEYCVTNSFRQDAVAEYRPWNFWYFPYADWAPGRKAYDSDGALGKYDQISPIPSSAQQWESDHHKISDPNAGWFGHCAEMSYASMYFQDPPLLVPVESPPPPPSTLVTFDQEDMELLLGEWTAAHRRGIKMWSVTENTDEYKAGNRGFDPSMPKPKKAWPEDYNDKYAGDIYSAFRDVVFIEKQCFNIDMEMEEPPAGTEMTCYQKWNQGVFATRASFAETEGSDNHLDITIDHYYDSSKDVFPSMDASTRTQHAQYRLVFNQDGTIDKDNPAQDLIFVKEGDKLRFAPGYGYLPTQYTIGDLGENPHIRLSVLRQVLGVKDNPKFKDISDRIPKDGS